MPRLGHYEAPPVTSIKPMRKKPKPEQKTVRLPLVVRPAFAKKWRDFCAKYSMSMTEATEMAMALYMQALENDEQGQ